jgi:hypothetical protein
MCIATTVTSATPNGDGSANIVLDLSIFVDNPASTQHLADIHDWIAKPGVVRLDVFKNKDWTNPLYRKVVTTIDTSGLAETQTGAIRFWQVRGRYARSYNERVTFTAREGDEIFLDLNAPNASRSSLGAGPITLTFGSDIIPNTCRFNTTNIHHDHGDHKMNSGGGRSDLVNGQVLVDCLHPTTVFIKSIGGYSLPGDQPGVMIDLFLNGQQGDLPLGVTGSSAIDVGTRVSWESTASAGPITASAVLVLDLY